MGPHPSSASQKPGYLLRSGSEGTPLRRYAMARKGGHVTADVTKEGVDESYEMQVVVEKMVDVTGIEPATPCLQSRCSPS
jgi:hypothetical protein